jgi:opacity protein-like surface antigen
LKYGMMLGSSFVALLVLTVGPARADGDWLRGGSSLVSGMVGYTTHESEQSGDRIGGGSWSFDYASVNRSERWAVGFALRRLESDESFPSQDGSSTIRINAKRLVAAVQTQWLIYDGRFTPYVGGLIGVHMQTSDVYGTADDELRQSSQTLAVGFSAGTQFHLTERVFARGEYTFYYFNDSDTLKRNNLSAFYGGVGFQFGGI